jgi:hypothetical protein
MADTKVSALTELSTPVLTDEVYVVGSPSGTPTSNNLTLARLFGQAGIVPGGRLTLTSGTPITTADVTGASTLYYTPHLHDRIRIYDGTRWMVYQFTERSLALSGLTAGGNYDVFIYDNAGTLTLELGAAWTNNTTRSAALTTQDGVTVKSGATTRLWLGTLRATSATTTEDSGGGSTTNVGGKRFVWNAYNRVRKFASVIDTTASWSYTTDTIRQARATAGNKVEYVCGAVADAIIAQACGIAFLQTNSARAAKVGVGVDSTTAFSGMVQGGYSANSGGIYAPVIGSYAGFPGLGYHYLSWNEKGADSTSTFLGNNGGDSQQSGLFAEVWS